MKILVEDLPPDGRTVRADLKTHWAKKAAAAVFEVEPTTLSVDLTVERGEGRRVVVRGTASATLTGTCDRCLADVRLEIGGAVDLTYAPESETTSESGDEVRLEEEELDLGWFDGLALDMGEVVSEQLSLWMPPRLLCEDPGVTRIQDGLCLPIAYDDGPEVKRESPFASLANLKLPE
ncbi:MAG: DUF177 domain-containing protein [Myxococcota bacterium]